MSPRATSPIIVDAGIDGNLRFLGRDVARALPASEVNTFLIADASTWWSGVCGLATTSSRAIVVSLHKDATSMQEPVPLTIGWMLDAAGMQLHWRDERPSLRVALHVQEPRHDFWRLCEAMSPHFQSVFLRRRQPREVGSTGHVAWHWVSPWSLRLTAASLTSCSCWATAAWKRRGAAAAMAAEVSATA
jgi:hypothetical protein